MEAKTLTLSFLVMVTATGVSAFGQLGQFGNFGPFGGLCNPTTEYRTQYVDREIPVRRLIYRDHLVPTTVYQPFYSTIYRTEYVPQYITTTSYLSHYNTVPDMYQPIPYAHTDYVPQFRTQPPIQTNQTSELPFRAAEKTVEVKETSVLPEPREDTTVPNLDASAASGVIAI